MLFYTNGGKFNYVLSGVLLQVKQRKKGLKDELEE